MNQYRIATLARRDISEIYRYIARDNLPAADRWLSRLHDRFALLARNPQSGESRESLSRYLRIVSFGNYVVLFRPGDGEIEIVRVVHGSRDVESVFRREQR